MPGRTTPLVVGEYYHLYNRGTEKREIFLQPRDYKRFVNTFFYYQFSDHKISFSKFTKSNLNIGLERSVEIICYCLMPNHFHFLIKQVKEGGISEFMSKISNSYTKYFNTKYDRVGPLLQGNFKSVRVESDEQLMHLSRYIHLNPVVSGLKSLEKYRWSSYLEFIGENSPICLVQEVLGLFPSINDYKEFTSQIDYGTTLEQIKHQTIDQDYDAT